MLHYRNVNVEGQLITLTRWYIVCNIKIWLKKLIHIVTIELIRQQLIDKVDVDYIKYKWVSYLCNPQRIFVREELLMRWGYRNLNC